MESIRGMTSTRQQLLAWVQAQGLVALEAVFREEAAGLAGPKGRHRSRARIITGARRRGTDVRRPPVRCPGRASGAGEGKRPCRRWGVPGRTR